MDKVRIKPFCNDDKIIMPWCYFYIITLCAYGFSKNFLSFNLFTDLAGFAMVCFIIFKRAECLNIRRTFFYMVTAFVGCCGFIALVNMYSFNVSLVGIRNYIFYIYFGLFISNFKRELSFTNVLNMLTRAGTFICFYAVLQFALQNVLPERYLRFVGAGFEGVFGFTEQPVLRVNGLLENTIVFGNFAMLIALLLFSKLLIFSRKKIDVIDVISFIIVLCSILMTFGRIAIVGTFLGLMLIFFLCDKRPWRTKLIILAVFVIAVAVVVLTVFGDSIIIQRILGGQESTNASNEIHWEKAKEGLKALWDNWLLGLGIGTQGYDRGTIQPIVEDGGFISYALELGVPTMLLFISLMAFVLIFAIKNINRNSSKTQLWCCSVLITITLLIFLSCIFNSSFLARANYGTYWVLVGAAFGLDGVAKKGFETDKKINYGKCGIKRCNCQL